MAIFGGKKDPELTESAKLVIEFAERMEPDVLDFANGYPLTIYSTDDSSQIYAAGMGFLLGTARGLKIRVSSLAVNLGKVEGFRKDLSDGRKIIALASTEEESVFDALEKKLDELNYHTLGAAALTIFPDPEMVLLPRNMPLQDFLGEYLKATQTDPDYDKLTGDYKDILVLTDGVLRYTKRFGWTGDAEKEFNELSKRAYRLNTGIGPNPNENPQAHTFAGIWDERYKAAEASGYKSKPASDIG